MIILRVTDKKAFVGFDVSLETNKAIIDKLQEGAAPGQPGNLLCLDTHENMGLIRLLIDKRAEITFVDSPLEH